MPDDIVEIADFAMEEDVLVPGDLIAVGDLWVLVHDECFDFVVDVEVGGDAGGGVVRQ